VNTGSAAWSSPARAAARSPRRAAGVPSTGSTTTGANPSLPASASASAALSLSAGGAAGVSASGVSDSSGPGSSDAGRVRVGSSARARRTLPVETPTAAAIARSDALPARRERMSATTCSVSFDGPFGPFFSSASAATPPSVRSVRQRHNVTVEASNAAATSTAVAASIRTNCTAARRRPTSSPASQTKVSSPRTNTRPPSASATTCAASPTGTAPAGTTGRGGSDVINDIIPTPTHERCTVAPIIAHRSRRAPPENPPPSGQTAHQPRVMSRVLVTPRRTPRGACP